MKYSDLIEARTYRICGHYGGDRATYRDQAYHEEMIRRYPDPIPRYEKVLIENSVATEQELEAIKQGYRDQCREVAAQVYEESLRETSRPTVEEVLDINTMWATPMEGLL